MIPLALGVAVVVGIVVAIFVGAAGAARARALAEDVRRDIEPYLRRKSAEAGLAVDAPTWTSRTDPEQIVSYAATLAARLNERERTGPPTQTANLAMAKTQRVEDSDSVVITDKLKGDGS